MKVVLPFTPHPQDPKSCSISSIEVEVPASGSLGFAQGLEARVDPLSSGQRSSLDGSVHDRSPQAGNTTALQCQQPTICVPTQPPTLTICPDSISASRTFSAFLSTLPPELHHYLLTRYLDFSGLCALRQTNSYFATLLTTTLLGRLRREIILDYLSIEVKEAAKFVRTRRFRDRWSYYSRGAYSYWGQRDAVTKRLRCYGCLELLPLYDFSQKMCTDGMIVGAKRAQGRRCKRCVVIRGWGTWGTWDKENYVERRHLCDLDTGTGRNSGCKMKRWGRVFTFGSTEHVRSDDHENARKHSKQISEHRPGICARCHAKAIELYWGCSECFEAEEKRRQQLDKSDLNVLQATILGGREKWEDFKADWRIHGPTNRGRGRARGRWKDLRFVGWKEAWEAEKDDWRARRAVVRRWRQKRKERKESFAEDENDGESDDGASPQKRGAPGTTRPGLVTTSASVDMRRQPAPLVRSRREIRCTSCWVPNCPRREYALGLAHEPPLPRTRWCGTCKRECRAVEKAREAKRLRQRGRFSFDGFGGLFGSDGEE